MATLNITINSANTIGDLNARVLVTDSPKEALNQLVDYVMGLASGRSAGTIIITSRDSDPSVGTSGAGSIQKTYTQT